MYQLPEDRTDWLVHDLLPSVGTSLAIASPKCGKSVMTRQLCAFVSQGKPFLGRDVKRGKTLYVSTQEQPGKIADHFRDLGCGEETFPFTVAGERIDPRSAVDQLSATICGIPDLKLVVVDMVADILPLHDTNDYSEMNTKFGLLRHLAEKHRLHVCLTHHLKKAQTENAANASIGSTAIAGSIDQILRLNVDARGQRSIDTVQRYGEVIPHTLLNWDAEQRAFYLGQGMEEVREQRKEETNTRRTECIFDAVRKYPGHTMEEILSEVTGKTTELRRIFRMLCTEGHLSRAGSGSKGDPYTYRLADPINNDAAR
jgi:RecA-family ATPase